MEFWYNLNFGGFGKSNLSNANVCGLGFILIGLVLIIAMLKKIPKTEISQGGPKITSN
jgi:hypothetical protein